MKKAARLRMEAARRAEGVCIKCGDKRDETYKPIEVCSGCAPNRYIPRWFEDAEDYKLDEVYGILRATKSPKSGVAMIDTPKPRHVKIASQRPR